MSHTSKLRCFINTTLILYDWNHWNGFWWCVESRQSCLRCVWINYQLADIYNCDSNLVTANGLAIHNVCVVRGRELNCADKMSHRVLSWCVCTDFTAHWTIHFALKCIVKAFSYHLERKWNQPLSKSAERPRVCCVDMCDSRFHSLFRCLVVILRSFM